MNIRHFAFCSVVLCFVVGCGPKDEEITSTTANTVAFEGPPDAKYAGTWKSSNGVSTYIFVADGTYKMDSMIVVRGQKPFPSHAEGQWKVSGDRMLMKDKAGNVVPYALEFKNDELKLTLTGSLKNETVLRRSK